MELFLNIVWLLISVSLAFFWKSGSRSKGSRYDRRAQFVALALLAVILLPVVSMTDDMHAMSTAEVEHAIRRVDLAPQADQPSELPDIFHPGLFLSLNLTSLHAFMRLEPTVQIVRPLTGSIRQTAKRPPPAI